MSPGNVRSTTPRGTRRSFNVLDLAGPLAAFDVPRRVMNPAPYGLTTFSGARGRIGVEAT